MQGIQFIRDKKGTKKHIVISLEIYDEKYIEDILEGYEADQIWQQRSKEIPISFEEAEKILDSES